MISAKTNISSISIGVLEVDKNRSYICIDLKSFYASVEAVERGLDPMTARLVVADPERSKNTICLAVSPALKALGVRNRCRIQEIPKNIDYICAVPRMQKYIDYSAEIYGVYLKYFSKDDIHVYSIDESFIDITEYFSLYRRSPRELGLLVMEDILETLGIRATCGIGTNLYLTKVALDILSKHSPDFIGELDEAGYRQILWDHRPLTDFWMIGRGTAASLERKGILTMEDIARADVDSLYRTYGINAEILIDHAWGREPTTIRDIKAYAPRFHSLTNGQMLMRDYDFEEAGLVVKEMADLLCLDLIDLGLITSSITLYVGYSMSVDQSAARGTKRFDDATNAPRVIMPEAAGLFERITDRKLPIRRLSITCNQVVPEEYVQLSLFSDREMLEKDRAVQKAVIEIKDRFGKDAVLRGISYLDGATTKIRSHQIGGHHSGT
ncbi:MAG: DNA repair protein [Lachnospiraceae bacterium]|nr:DNA repair protein [Lachnospiraceae bacterium]